MNRRQAQVLVGGLLMAGSVVYRTWSPGQPHRPIGPWAFLGMMALLGLVSAAFRGGRWWPEPAAGLSAERRALEARLWRVSLLGLISIGVAVAIGFRNGVIPVLPWWARLPGVVGLLALFAASFVHAGGLSERREPRTASALTVAALGTAQSVVAIGVVLTRSLDVVAVFSHPQLWGWGSFALLPMVAWYAVLVVAGAQLRQHRLWARRWVLANGIVTVLLWVVLPALRGDGAAPWTGLVDEWRRFPIVALFTAAPLAIAVVALVVLSRPSVAARFPSGDRSSTNWPALLATAYVASIIWASPRPRPEERAAEAEARRVREAVAEPGTASVTLRPLYDGRPLEGLGGQDVHVWLHGRRNEGLVEPEAVVRDGVVELSPVKTGVYWVNAAIDLDPTTDLGPQRAGMPGDLETRARATISALKNGEASTADVPFLRIVRLREPEDTGLGVPRGPQDVPHVTSPVRYSWDAIPGARRYVATVDRGLPGAGGVVRLAEATLATTQWTVDLPPTAAGDTYAFDLHVFGDATEIAELQIQGVRFYGWRYQFVVDPPAH